MTNVIFDHLLYYTHELSYYVYRMKVTNDKVRMHDDLQNDLYRNHGNCPRKNEKQQMAVLIPIQKLG